MSDQTGQIIWKANYKAWGECQTENSKSNIFESNEIITNNIRFQGQYFDKEAGLHYNRHRYYSPHIGRYISKDPIGLLGGHNVYAYAPNPVEWVDPRGLAKDKGGKGKNNSAANTKRKQPCPKNVCEGKDPAAEARAWQGPGNEPYLGVDAYTNTVIKKGTILYTLYPHGMKPNILSNPTPNYYVDHKHVLSTRGKGARAYNDAIQISHNDNYSGARPMRTQLHKFVVTKDICVAQGVAKNNSNFGAGGGTQYFISNNDKMSIKPTTMIYKIK